jgi:hypothetical protein
MQIIWRIPGKTASAGMLMLTVWCLPLIICNQMMWDFYYPKELFFQLMVAIALVLRLNCKKIIIGFNLLDIVVIFNLLCPVLFSIFYHHIHFDCLRLPLYSVLFYLLIQCLDFHNRNEYFRFLTKTIIGLFAAGCLVAFYGISQYFGADFLHPHGIVTFGPKVVGTLGHANIMGGLFGADFSIRSCHHKSSQRNRMENPYLRWVNRYCRCPHTD